MAVKKGVGPIATRISYIKKFQDVPEPAKPKPVRPAVSKPTTMERKHAKERSGDDKIIKKAEEAYEKFKPGSRARREVSNLYGTTKPMGRRYTK